MNNTIHSEVDEIEFARKMSRVLDESTNYLPTKTAKRLEINRKSALRHRPKRIYSLFLTPNLAFSGLTQALSSGFQKTKNWGGVLPMLVLMTGLLGIYQYEQQHHIIDIADIDTALLSDELPLEAYLDRGFHTYLNNYKD